MKKFDSYYTAFTGLMTSVFSDRTSNMVFASQLPVAIKGFIRNHFPKQSIAHVTMDTGINNPGYEVSLNDGANLYFSFTGIWSTVDCMAGKVPVSLIPVKVASQVDKQFGNTSVVKIGRSFKDYELLLSNGITLKYDQDANLI